MLYLTGLTPEEVAKQRSRLIAQEQGCTGNITEYWFRVIKHPNRDEWALCVNEEYKHLLTEEEQSNLKTQEQLKSDGWMPEVTHP